VALENANLMDQAVWNGTHDTLTNLSDRSLFEKSLDRALASSVTTSTTVALLYIDIDQFKRTNDTLGHPAGDIVLKHVAAILLAATRDSDVVARMGGDEFVVLLANLRNKRTADQVVKRIRAELETPLRIGSQEMFVSFSIGIAFSDAVDAGLPVKARAHALIASADAAMYEEKATRAGVPPKPVHRRELTIDTALHGAVARGEVTVAYQPQLDLRTQQITGVEALARWVNPELGEVAPTEFIPVAEKNGLIGELGAEILRQACSLGHELMVKGHPVTVAVNASVRELMDDSFLDRVSTIISASGCPPDRVTFEMTETQLVADIPQLITRLQGLRVLGAGVSLDDFGTGNTSLMQLYDLPLTELKIDQSFIARDGPIGEALIRGIIAISHQIDITVVTEGIETHQQADVVRQLGSDRIQGYHVARPMNRDTFIDWLTDRDAAPSFANIGTD
jgi:diguanylate cyclase (GGDEF)-like protein